MKYELADRDMADAVELVLADPDTFGIKSGDHEAALMLVSRIQNHPDALADLADEIADGKEMDRLQRENNLSRADALMRLALRGDHE